MLWRKEGKEEGKEEGRRRGKEGRRVGGDKDSLLDQILIRLL